MAGVYDIGDTVPLIYTISAAATVVCTVTDPDGGTSTPTVTQGGSPPAVTYTANVAATKAGTWTARFVATGAVTDAEDILFYVNPLLAPNQYVTVPELRDALGDATANRIGGSQLEQAIRAASQAVDDWCQRPGRKFWLDPTATIRTYRPDDPYCAWVEDIGSMSGLVVKTDTAGDGTYATTWNTTDYQLEPLNASGNGGAYAWWQLVAVGSRTFPALRGWGGQRPTLQVTARHGWSQIPDPVREATLLLAVRLYRRKDVPFGNEAGGGDFGPIRITAQDSDVKMLLAPYAIPQGFG